MHVLSPELTLLKRAFDIVVAAVVLVLLSPVMVVIAGVIRATMGAPVLFRQLRPGRHGRPFTIVKFRTMMETVGPDGHALPDGERLTRVGRFLRRSSLDELPELWNVFRGDMSLVGPRPLLMEYLPAYTREQARRHDVRPGITGLAQVSGRNELDWEERFAVDVWYVDHGTFLLDLRILARTVAQVLLGRGVNQPGHATMRSFLEKKP